MRDVIKDLPPEALNWNPLPEDVNSIYTLVTHVCGSETFWIQQMIGGKDVRRDRDSEFVSRGERLDDLLDLLDRTQEATATVLSKETSESLSRMIRRWPDMPPKSALAWVLRCLRHGVVHQGHTELTKQLWEAR